MHIEQTPNETDDARGERPEDWPGNKYNICYGCGRVFRGRGWKINPLCKICDPHEK